MDRFVVISGCSGGGKSALLAELRRRGHSVVEEPGRRIIAEELNGAGTALPWVDLAAFAQRAIDMALRDRVTAKEGDGWVFFDRGLVDAAAALEHATGKPVLKNLAEHRYHQRVFMTPPWPEIYVQDEERRHGLDDAAAEYARLLAAFSALSYDVEILPKVGISQRADLIIERLSMH